MDKRRKIGEPEHRAASLNGMKITEDLIDQPRILRALLKIDQAPFEALEQLYELFLKDCNQIIRHQPNTFFTTARSLSWVNGLTIQPKAPASRA